MSSNIPWSTELASRLKALMDAGSLSASQLGAAIGKSRNAVIGYAKRQGWPLAGNVGNKTNHPKKAASERARPNNRYYVRDGFISVAERLPEQPKISVDNDHLIPVERRKSFAELGETECRWPVGEVGQPGFFFCGAAQEEGSAYCPEHKARSIITLTKQPAKSSQAPTGQQIEITKAMVSAGRDALLASFPEDVLSERTAGLDRAVSDIFRAMLERSGKSFSETR